MSIRRVAEVALASFVTLSPLAALAGCGASAPAASNAVEVPSPPPAEGRTDPPREVAGAGRWLTDEAAAQALAKDARLPLLVDFRAEWCAACKELERRTYPDPRVDRELHRFALLRVDATNDDDPNVKRLIAQYGVVGLPTLIALDSSGHEVKRLSDFVAPNDLLAALAPIR